MVLKLQPDSSEEHHHHPFGCADMQVHNTLHITRQFSENGHKSGFEGFDIFIYFGNFIVFQVLGTFSVVLLSSF